MLEDLDRDIIPTSFILPLCYRCPHPESVRLLLRELYSGEQTIMVTVQSKPARAGIDPYHLLIDWEADDNITKVKT